MDYGKLQVEQEGGVLVVTLDDPASRNALSLRMASELSAVLAGVSAGEIEADCLMIIGAGQGRGSQRKAAKQEKQAHGGVLSRPSRAAFSCCGQDGNATARRWPGQWRELTDLPRVADDSGQHLR